MPIVRSFAPLVAGVGRMSYGRFLTFNVAGGIAWVALLTGAGFFFGNIPLIKNNYSLAIVAIVAVSTAPMAVECVRRRRRR